MFRQVLMPVAVAVFGIYALGNIGVLEMPLERKAAAPASAHKEPAQKEQQPSAGRLTDRVSNAQPSQGAKSQANLQGEYKLKAMGGGGAASPAQVQQMAQTHVKKAVHYIGIVGGSR